MNFSILPETGVIFVSWYRQGVNLVILINWQQRDVNCVYDTRRVIIFTELTSESDVGMKYSGHFNWSWNENADRGLVTERLAARFALANGISNFARKVVRDSRNRTALVGQSRSRFHQPPFQSSTRVSINILAFSLPSAPFNLHSFRRGSPREHLALV